MYRKGRIVAVATIGRAIKNWRETARVRRETAAELIGRVIKNWRETNLSVAPCWKESWSPYCRPWLSWKKSLRAISNAELGMEIVTEMNHWDRMAAMVASGIIPPEVVSEWLHLPSPRRRFWRAHPTVQHPETDLSLPRLRTAIARLGIGVVPGMLLGIHGGGSGWLNGMTTEMTGSESR